MKLQELIDFTYRYINMCARSLEQNAESEAHGAAELAVRLAFLCDDIFNYKMEKVNDRDKIYFTFSDDEGTIEPTHILKIDGHTFPIYMDDYGQCFFIRINKECYGAGTYNCQPEGEFIPVILTHLFQEKIGAIKKTEERE